jgi:DNA invertase Pin-like site-specific DNA recombinase
MVNHRGHQSAVFAVVALAQRAHKGVVQASLLGGSTICRVKDSIQRVEMHLVSRAVNAGVNVYSTDKQERMLDENTTVGRTALAMIGGFNEMAREKTRTYTMQGNRMRALKGMPLVGQKPAYGYRWIEEESTTLLTGASKVRKVRYALDEQDEVDPA